MCCVVPTNIHTPAFYLLLLFFFLGGGGWGDLFLSWKLEFRFILTAKKFDFQDPLPLIVFNDPAWVGMDIFRNHTLKL